MSNDQNVFQFGGSSGFAVRQALSPDRHTQWSVLVQYLAVGAAGDPATVDKFNVWAGAGGSFQLWSGVQVPYAGICLPSWGYGLSELSFATTDANQILQAALVPSGVLLPRALGVNCPAAAPVAERLFRVPDFAQYYSITPYIDGTKQYADLVGADLIETVVDANASIDSAVGLNPRCRSVALPAASHGTGATITWHLFGKVG